MKFLILCLFLSSLTLSSALQEWIQQPENKEVNPGGDVILNCRISNLMGGCRWEKDGVPVGVFDEKYEWAGNPDTGDCSLRILNAELKYDDGVWQCEVTPSSFKSKDALISEGAQVVVRESPNSIVIKKVGDVTGDQVTVSAGEELELQCVVTGGNPPAEISWHVRGSKIESGHVQDNSRSPKDSRTWVSVSRLRLPMSKEDDGSKITCFAKHPTLAVPISTSVQLSVHYSPVVRIETSPYDLLEDARDPVTLKCLADSNPPATIIWKKEGLSGIFSPDPEIHISPVSKHSAGTYSCEAENGLGRSKPVYYELDVKYGPGILAVGPSKVVHAQKGEETVLTCEAEGNPEPRYQWLQKLPEGVVIRGYEKNLVIKETSYDHQGPFVCKAVNEIRKEVRTTQSEPIRIEVSGPPQVMQLSSSASSSSTSSLTAHSVLQLHEVRVQNGENAELKVLFCADPMPREAEWHLDNGMGQGKPVSLVPGTGDTRFFAQEFLKAENKENCYYSILRINGAHQDDSHEYRLRLKNEHGEEWHSVLLQVNDLVTQESLIAIVVSGVITFLILLLALIYCCKSGRCCCSSKHDTKLKPNDMESEKTDVESTHSSNLSGYPHEKALSAIPPDALYTSSEKQQQHFNHHRTNYHQQQQHHDVMFNDSKESLRPDMMINVPQASSNFSHSNLNRTHSSSGELNVSQQRISYNDLCFPKTSNYGSMKKKKQNHVGVECRLARGYAAPPAPMPGVSPPSIHSAYY